MAWLSTFCECLQGKPEIKEMVTTRGQFDVTATFTVYNKPVNAFWALFQVCSTAGCLPTLGVWRWAGCPVCLPVEQSAPL
jgi:hypothetical protein